MAAPRPVPADEQEMTPDQRRQARAFRWLVEHEQGRNFLRDLLRPLRDPSFSVEPLRMAYHEGLRAKAMEVRAQLLAFAPEGLIEIEAEEVRGGGGKPRVRDLDGGAHG